MSLKSLEARWKKALTSILEELTESQFKKLLFNLDKIPQGVKSGKVREEIPLIIIQYYGAEVSISVIDKEMKQIPRMDATIQDLLRPLVDKLKKQRQKNKGTTSKSAADSGPVAKKQKPAAGTTSKSAADSGPVAKKQKPAAGATSKLAADSGPVAKKQKPAADQQKSCQPDKKKTISSQLGTKATAVKVVQDSAQCTNQEERKLDPVGPVKPKQKKTEKQDSSLKSTKISKVQSAAVQTGKTIVGNKKANKTKPHLVAEFSNQL